MSVESFCKLLVRSRLHPPEKVRNLFQRWQIAARDPSNVTHFARWLIANQFLTEYQANLLGKGQADGFVVGPYQVLDRIARGRMAGVYKALGQQGQVVAVKVLPPSKAKDPETLARFKRAARLAIKLNHPNLVRTFQVGVADDLHYLVMELLEGETLEALLKKCGALSPLEAVRIAYLTTLGMQHIQEQGLVHRDLNPGNLMLCPAPPEGENTLRSSVKILDIGLGRKLFDPRSDAVSEGLTNEESILGSPDYLAPEQARDARRVDIRADIYSLGCTLYHMLAGRPPFQDDNFIRQIMRHANEEPQALHELNRAIPPQLSQIVATMLAKRREDRYPTPAATAAALQGMLGGKPTEKTDIPPKQGRG
jgi:serine/threonine protein kinase